MIIWVDKKMIELEKDCYLVNFDKRNEFSVGSMFMGKVVVSIELYYLDEPYNKDLSKYIKIKTMPINFKI